MLALSAVAAILGAATLTSATSELRGGITEVPQHWWSSLAAAPLVIGSFWPSLASG